MIILTLNTLYLFFSLLIMGVLCAVVGAFFFVSPEIQKFKISRENLPMDIQQGFCTGISVAADA